MKMFRPAQLRTRLALFGLAVSFGASAMPPAPRDILVIGSHISDSGLVSIDPVTAGQTFLVPTGVFEEPGDVALEPSGDILVVDYITNENNQIYRVDPETGAATPIHPATYGDIANIAVSPLGEIFATVNTSQLGGDQVLRIDPLSGVATVITQGGFLRSPTGLLIEADGSLVVADYNESSLIRVNPATGGQTVLASGDGVRQVWDIALEDDGSIVVANDFKGTIVRVHPVTGAQTNVAPDGTFATPSGIAVDIDGSLLVTDRGYSQVVRLDPITGQTSLVASDGFLTLPADLAVYATGAPILTCSGFEGAPGLGPVSATKNGVLPLLTDILNDQGIALGAGSLATPPVLQVEFMPVAPVDPPADVTSTLLAPRAINIDNKFVFYAPVGKWAHGFLTNKFSARGSYRLSMVTGDPDEYVFDQTCTATYVVE